ncbi:MAG: hypothetical protein ACR2H3_14890 [Acidimicrobiales bacterium]
MAQEDSNLRRGIGRRLALGLLALNAAQIGLWAALAPANWFRTFPGFGQAWAAVDGPFNEHLTRDVGNLFLALTVVTVIAAFRPERLMVRTAAAAWLVMSVPHFAYHASHTDLLPTSSAVMSLAGLALGVGVPLWLLISPEPKSAAATATPTAEAGSSNA